MLNNINLFFGPSIPANIDCLPLSFISGAKATPNESVAYLSSERYVHQNYSTFYTYAFQPSGNVVTSATIEASYVGTTVNGTTSNMLDFDLPRGNALIKDGAIQFNSIHSPILVTGIQEGRTGAFYPVVKNGLVWRFYRVKDTEPDWSWLKKAGLVTGDEVLLIYTVPETRYGKEESIHSNEKFLNNFVGLKERVEVPGISSPTTLKYFGDAYYITEIKVNGSNKFSGKFSNGDSSTFIRSVDHQSKTIHLKQGLNPEDKVQIKYIEYNQTYTYKGFTYQDSQGVRSYYPFDCNPEHGHYIGDSRDDTWKPSSLALLEQVLIYLIPSAFIHLTFSTPGSGHFDGTLIFDSAFNYGETHFVRHYVGATTETFDLDLGILPDNWFNYWGRVPFSHRNWDAPGSESLNDDIFSEFLPSLMPLGKIILSAAQSFRSIEKADVRQRGGGVPEDFSQTGLDQQSDGLDQIRGMWDTSIWQGKLQQDGGSVDVKINKNVLETMSKEQVDETVRFMIPPGIHYEIKYIEF
jgi:hypothetical protein